MAKTLKAEREEPLAGERRLQESANTDRRRWIVAHTCVMCLKVHPNIRSGFIYGDGVCPRCRTKLWDDIFDAMDRADSAVAHDPDAAAQPLTESLTESSC